ncbi:MAG: hypothetical protein EA369_05750 [Bradymonadales bacterium]|nr:MAG: hypothetical protein EA369_05750 [Bradymonadales bacterium]
MKLKEIQQLNELFLMSLQAGRDWVAALQWLAQSNSKQAPLARRWVAEIETMGAQPFLLKKRAEALREEESIFFEILLIQQKGQGSLIQALSQFQDLIFQLSRVREIQRNLFLIPIAQGGFCLLFCFVLAVVLPILLPDLFRSFLHFGRWDLFLYGLFPLGLGAFLLHRISIRSEKRLQQEVCGLPALHFLSIRIQAGEDIQSAWGEMAKGLRLPSCLASIQRKNQTQSFQSRLEESLPKMVSPWDRILLGISWTMKTGVGVAQFLDRMSQEESQRLFALAEYRLRKDSLLSLLPLVFLCFPGCLYLVMGPAFYELQLNWEFSGDS